MMLLNLPPTPNFMPPDANGPAGFTTVWHGHGAGHQANNDPGDTAADRHNFDGATAGKSGVNPMGGGNGPSESGLPMVPVKPVAFGDDDDLPADVLADLFS